MANTSYLALLFFYFRFQLPMDDLVGKEIILGTYEAFVLGYKVSEDKKTLVTKFCHNSLASH